MNEKNMNEKNVDKIMTDGSIRNSNEEKALGFSGDIFSGTVKWFSSEKGFGFVNCSDGRDIFVYYTEIQIEGFKTLQKGQKVAMEIFSGERGPEASNVRLIQ